MEHGSSYNYLHFEIQDPEGKVRANLIGSEHQVRVGDSQLNQRIIETIKSSSKAILEMLPKTRVITFSKADHVLENVKKIHTGRVTHESEIQSVEELKVIIQGKTSPQNFAKVETALLTIQEGASKKFLLTLHENKDDFNSESSVEKLKTIIKDKISPQDFAKIETTLVAIQDESAKKFLLTLHENIDDFNLVSLEQNINAVIEKHGIPMKPLEKYDMNDLFRRAENDMRREAEVAKAEKMAKVEKLLTGIKNNTSPENFTQVEAALLTIEEADREKFLLTLHKNLADFSLASPEQSPNSAYDIVDLIRQAEDDMKLKAKAEDEIRPVPRDPKVIMAEIHEAWRQGDGQTLAKLLVEDDPNMPAQIQEVMKSRDENIAKRIIDLVSAPQAQAEKPLIFMVGAGHLVDTRWKNVFSHLADAFAEGGDLSGWKIVQVKSSPIKADENEK